MAAVMRLQRALARAGVASRRQVEAMISAGRVTVNGTVATLGQSVDTAHDRVQLDGKAVSLAPPPATWLVLHKPAGTMTTRRDPEGRRTVFDLVPETPGLTYVGRLDFLTEGVLLFTTDGDAAHRLTHPSTEIERVYVATVRGNAKAAAEQARRGVVLDDGPVVPAWVNVVPVENRRWAFEVCLREGRTHEVRRLCTALGLEVERLVRTQFGPVRLGQLDVGKARTLNGREIAVLEALLGRDLGVKPPSPSQRRRDRERRERGASTGKGEARPAAGGHAGPARPSASERGSSGRPPKRTRATSAQPPARGARPPSRGARPRPRGRN